MLDRIRFKEDENLIELHKDIYLYKNFFDPEEIKKYEDILNAFPEEDWTKHENFEPGDMQGTFWGDKTSLDIIDSSFHDKIFNFFAPNYWMYQHTNFVRLKAGQESPLNFNQSVYNEGCKIAEYKVAVYLGDFEGGELVFPGLELTYKPESNDLLIFKVDEDYFHLTEEVTSGVRYAYMDFLVYHPGYFMP